MIQWLMEARKIGKRLVSLDLPAHSQLSDETHEVICGVAGCVAEEENQTHHRVIVSVVGTPYLVSRYKKARYRSGPGDGGPKNTSLSPQMQRRRYLEGNRCATTPQC